MAVHKKVMVGGAVLSAAAIAAIVGLGNVSAASTTSTLVEKIAQKFNLSKDEVQKVFDQDRSEHQAQHEKRYEERLAQAVKDGKLTEDQKSKILAKHKELAGEMEANRSKLQGERASLESKTEAERQALMQQHRSEMDKKRQDIEAWEKANNIPSGYLFGGPGGGHGHGPGGGPGRM